MHVIVSWLPEVVQMGSKGKREVEGRGKKEKLAFCFQLWAFSLHQGQWTAVGSNFFISLPLPAIAIPCSLRSVSSEQQVIYPLVKWSFSRTVLISM